MVAPLDGGPAVRLVASTSGANYANGHLLYLNGTTLVAQALAPTRFSSAPKLCLSFPT